MGRSNKPEGAVFWCPRHGDEHLEAEVVEVIFGAVDMEGLLLHECPEETIYRRVWCEKCNRIIKEQYAEVITEEEGMVLWRKKAGDLQRAARREIGRELREKELAAAQKHLDGVLETFFCDLASEAINLAVYGVKERPRDLRSSLDVLDGQYDGPVSES